MMSHYHGHNHIRKMKPVPLGTGLDVVPLSPNGRLHELSFNSGVEMCETNGL
jgi:hypothetical protein